MAELGEMVFMMDVDEQEVECPFDHELKKVDVKNHFVGSGGELGTKMTQHPVPQSTYIYQDEAKFGPNGDADKHKKLREANEKIGWKEEGPDGQLIDVPPENDPNDFLHDVQASWMRWVGGPDPGEETLTEVTGRYPVGFAAHHLIPAQASLRDSPLLAWMCKYQEAQEFKGKPKKKQWDVVWSNVGYDVNGFQNGVFLPGNYWVGRQSSNPTGTEKIPIGTQHWVRDQPWGPNDDDDIEPDPAIFAKIERYQSQPGKAAAYAASPLLTGPTGLEIPVAELINDFNGKWAYVSTVVATFHGQFHDSHVDYNKFVRTVLLKIAANYTLLRRDMWVNEKCGECKKIKEKTQNDKDWKGMPPPYGIITRLNKLSANLSNCLNGTNWRPNIYTSNWGRAYMATLQKKTVKLPG